MTKNKSIPLLSYIALGDSIIRYEVLSRNMAKCPGDANNANADPIQI